MKSGQSTSSRDDDDDDDEEEEEEEEDREQAGVERSGEESDSERTCSSKSKSFEKYLVCELIFLDNPR